MPWIIESPKAASGSKWIIEPPEDPEAAPVPPSRGPFGAAISTIAQELLGGGKQLLLGGDSEELSDPPSGFLPVDLGRSAVNSVLGGRAGGALRIAGAIPEGIGAGLEQQAKNIGVPDLAAKGIGFVGSTAAGFGTGKMAQATSRAARRSIPYVVPGAAEAVKERGLDLVRQFGEDLTKGKIPSKEVYAMVSRLNPPPIKKLPALHGMAKELKAAEQGAAKWGQESQEILDQAETLLKLQRPTTETITKTNPNVLTAGGQPIQQTATKTVYPEQSFDEIRDFMQRVGKRIDELRDPMRAKTGHNELGAMKRILRATWEDLDNLAAKQPTGGAGLATRFLKAANVRAKREFATKELEDAIQKGVATVQGHELREVPNFAKMLTAVEKEIAGNELFSQALSPGEIGELKGLLERFRKLPQASLAKGQNAGSFKRAATAAMGGFLGTVAEKGLGIPYATAGGVAIGTFGADALANALIKPGGRKFILGLVEREPSIMTSPYGWSILAAANRAGAFDE